VLLDDLIGGRQSKTWNGMKAAGSRASDNPVACPLLPLDMGGIASRAWRGAAISGKGSDPARKL